MRKLIWLATLLVSLVFAAGASAATPTTTSITTPSDPYFGLYSDTGGSSQTLTISGTSNGTSGDVDILCYSDNGSTGSSIDTVDQNVPIASNGDFTATVSLSIFSQTSYGPTNNSDTTTSPCRLRAVPSGTTPTSGLSSYSGPRIAVAFLNHFSGSAGLYDYYIYAPALSAAEDLVSFSDCGLYDSFLFDPSVFGQLDTAGFYCNDYEGEPAVSNPSRPGVLVDGHPAYGPDEEYGISKTASGFEPLVLNSVTQNTSNGDVEVVETDPLARCQGDPFPPTSSNCTVFTSSGVQLKRTVLLTDGGHMAYVLDSYSSTDGSPHEVSLLLENDQNFGFPGNSTSISYSFPGTSGYQTYSSGQTVSVPAKAPASIYVEQTGSPDGTTSSGRGAITYAQSPSGPFAFGKNTKSFDAPNTVSVPASGSVSVRYAYSTEFTQAAVNHDSLVAEDAFLPPQLTITSPKQGATIESGSAKVSGSVQAGSGVKSVTVDGKSVSVTSAGGFSASVPLHAGKNTITVTLTSNAGKTVTKTVTVYVRVAATTGAATGVARSAATLTGKVETGSQRVSWYFEYGRSGYRSRTSTHTLSGSASPSKVSASISGLRPGTRYRYRLVITYGGHTARGAARTFTTKARRKIHKKHKKTSPVFTG